MTIFDFVLILAVLGCVFALFVLCYFLIRRRWSQAKRVFLALVMCVALYAAVLVSVALLSPQHVLSMRQERCFDDWCLSVERDVRESTIGIPPTTVTARGQFYLVTVRVSSRARGISQRAQDVQVYLLDARNQRYDPSVKGQQALDSTGQGGPPLDSEVAAGGSFTRTLVFDLPPDALSPALVVTHGLFPSVIVIADEQSFFHKPTIIQLQ